MRGTSGSTLFTTNTLSPYILTCLVAPPKRLVFLSSQLHHGGDASLKNLQHCDYSDSKLHNTMMAFAFARKFPAVEVSSLDPGEFCFRCSQNFEQLCETCVRSSG